MESIEEYLTSKGCIIKPAGQNEIHTHCWYCDEDSTKRGRLYVNTDMDAEPLGLFSCFLCGESGAYNKIRKHFGDPVIKSNDYEENSPATSKQHSIFQAAAKYYFDKLAYNEEAFEYLRETRGLSLETIEKHQLGWADGGLTEHLLGKGHQLGDLLRSGLTKEDQTDFHVNKIAIPYHRYGSVITIRGKDMEGKYRGLPGSKSPLFNTDACHKSDRVVICEGEFDCLVMEQMGFDAVGVPGATTWQDGWTSLMDEAQTVFICFDMDKAGQAGAEKTALKIGSKARVVQLPEETLPNGDMADISDLVTIYGYDAEEFRMLLIRSRGGMLLSVREAYEKWLEIEGNPDLKGMKIGLSVIDNAILPGLLPGQVMITLAKTGVGKSCPISSLIPSPKGFVKIGDLQIGDHIFGSNGKPTQVTGVYDRGVLDTFRVTFTDKSYLDVGLDHMWTVAYRYGRYRDWKWTNLTTSELIQNGLRKNKEYKYIIPMTSAVHYTSRDLPIDPYTLGALIANGCMTTSTVRLTTPDYDVVKRIEKAHKMDCYSYEKFIPEEYLLSSIEQRVALLQGLMDGDGGNRLNDGRKSVCYFTSSSKLTDDIVELVNSLGGTAMQNWTEREDCRPECRINIMMPEDLSAFSTERKTGMVSTAYRTAARRAIASIEKIGQDEHRCIKVDAEDHLYLASRSYVVTHNTISMLNMFHNILEQDDDVSILFLSLEQTRNEWFERAQRIYRFYHPFAEPKEVLQFYENRFLLTDKNRVTEDDLISCVEQFEFETGRRPSLLAVDYLGYWARSYKGEAYERTSAAIMAMKSIAKEFEFPVITPHQVSRMGEAGEEISLNAARDSVTGETLVTLANGSIRRIDQLVGEQPKLVVMDNDFKFVHRKAEKIWKKGERKVFDVTTKSGKRIGCTASHPFLTVYGWKRLDELVIGDSVAVARSVPVSPTSYGSKGEALEQLAKHREKNNDSDRWDSLPATLWSYIHSVRKKKGMYWSDVFGKSGVDERRNITKDRVLEIANRLDDEWLKQLALGDVRFEPIRDIVERGTEPVYDISVRSLHNFIANDILVKNSGVVEETGDFLVALWNADQKVGTKQEERHGHVKAKILKSRHGGTGHETVMQFAPLTLALAERSGPHFNRAANEHQFVMHGGKVTFDDVMKLHQSKELYIPEDS